MVDLQKVKDVPTEKKDCTEIACDKFSVHTLQIRIPLKDVTEYWKVNYLLSEKLGINREKSCDDNQSDFCVTPRKKSIYYGNKMYKLGLWDFYLTRKIVENFSMRHSLFFKVNPRVLLGYKNNNTICVVPTSDHGEIMQHIREVLAQTMFIDSDICDRITLYRIDLVSNILLDSQEQAERYLKLLSKPMCPYHMQKKLEYSKISHRMTPPQNAIVIKNETKEVAIYLKHKQMIDRMEKDGIQYSEDELERAKGQIRFEIRMSRASILYVSKSLEDREAITFINEASVIGRTLFFKMLVKMYGKGRFIKYQAACELIKKSDSHGMQRRTKEAIIGIMELLRNGKRDIGELLLVCDKADRRRFADLIEKASEKYGISLITIPREWPEKEFENPLTYICRRNVNDRD